MIVVSHELAFARDVANRVLFMDEGRVVEEGPPDQVLVSPTTDRAEAVSPADRGRHLMSHVRTGPVGIPQGLGSTPVRCVAS